MGRACRVTRRTAAIDGPVETRQAMPSARDASEQAADDVGRGAQSPQAAPDESRPRSWRSEWKQKPGARGACYGPRPGASLSCSWERRHRSLNCLRVGRRSRRYRGRSQRRRGTGNPVEPLSARLPEARGEQSVLQVMAMAEAPPRAFPRQGARGGPPARPPKRSPGPVGESSVLRRLLSLPRTDEASDSFPGLAGLGRREPRRSVTVGVRVREGMGPARGKRPSRRLGPPRVPAARFGRAARAGVSAATLSPGKGEVCARMGTGRASPSPNLDPCLP